MNESITSSFVFGLFSVQAIFLYKPFKYLFGILVVPKQLGGRTVYDLLDCEFEACLSLELVGLPLDALVDEPHDVDVREL